MKSKSMATLLALFLGGLGAHKFYLGRAMMGLLYLLFCWTFVPSIIALLDALVLLTMSEHDFNLRYNAALMNAPAPSQQIAQSVTIQVPGPDHGTSTGSIGSVAEQLKQLSELHISGVLTEEEFVAQKQRLLHS